MKMCERLRRDEVSGRFGVEVEVEGTNLPAEIEGWSRKEDGSLRGESAEYVFNRPVQLAATTRRLNTLREALKEDDVVVNFSDRCSVHVHLNVSDMQESAFSRLITLYALFEPVLVKFCGESREGNKFCLRMEDAGAIFEVYRTCIRNPGRIFDLFERNSFRYSSLNIVDALYKFCSVEFRAMRGTVGSELDTWIKIINEMYTASIDNTLSRNDIIECLLNGRIDSLARDIFKTTYNSLFKSEDDIVKVIRNASDVFFILLEE